MPNTEKIFRDPLYNYVSIDCGGYPWLLELLNTREVQRLRRIHQLGVSHFTYPGADHSRFSHSLGVLHLALQALAHLKSLGVEVSEHPEVQRYQAPLFAAAILHDVGHGPFSHLFEPCLGVKHEEWSCRIIRSPETEVNRVLEGKGITPDDVAALIEKEGPRRPPWLKNLLSSESDVDRLDYLRRDSLFTGAGYGHFDWYRILHSFDFKDHNGQRMLVWPSKARHAIEEYIFARFYMYHNVYLHKTTRGFEKLLHAVWRRASQLRNTGDESHLLPPIAAFVDAESPSTQQYLAIEDATLVYQLHVWANCNDSALADLAGRFLNRKRFVMIEAPEFQDPLGLGREAWEVALQERVESRNLKPADCYALRDDLKMNVYAPYSSEKEAEEQVPYNAIFVEDDSGDPKEISGVLERLKPFTGSLPKRFRYYVPKEVAADARALRVDRKW